MEKTMLRSLVAVASILAVGSFGFISAQATPASHTAHAKRAHHHVAHRSSEITSFSSSSAPAGLNIGVNHPPKK
jgi:hypothetical protein